MWEATFSVEYKFALDSQYIDEVVVSTILVYMQMLLSLMELMFLF